MRWAVLGAALTAAGCYHPDAHVSGTYAAANAEPVTASTDGAPARPCALAAGALTLYVPVPDGFALAVSPEACMLVDEASDSPVFLTFTAIPMDSDRAEDALLGATPDGVRAWALATELLGPDARPHAEGRSLLFGEPAPYFVLRATPPGLEMTRDALLMSAPAGAEHVVILAVMPPDDEARREGLLSLVAAVTR